jgi:hypothetical protein
MVIQLGNASHTFKLSKALELLVWSLFLTYVYDHTAYGIT